MSEAGAHWTDSFFAESGLEIVRDPERERTAPLEADWIMRVLDLRPGDRLLDIPCGTGRIAYELGCAGIRVLGIDRHPDLIREARARCRGLQPPPVFQTGDLLELDHPPRFQAAINWWGSFGYFSDAENLDSVRRMVRSLGPEGRLLLDTVNREHLRRFALGRHEILFADTRFRYTVRWEPTTERLEGDWIISNESGSRNVHSSIRLYTPTQMRRLGEQAGLADIRLFGDWTGTPYHRGAHRLILYGRRP
jgi:SAM-dependent methyltransferase